jgi:hypothetical protein
MSENVNETINEKLRATRGLRIEAKPAQQSPLSKVVNRYVREEAAKSVTHIPLDSPLFRNENNPRK